MPSSKINWGKQYALCLIPVTGYIMGRFMHKMEVKRTTQYRDKSSLYGRTLAPGEPPSWPSNSIAG